MRRRVAALLALAAVAACGGDPEPAATGTPASRELTRLGLRPIGPTTILDSTVPARLDDPKDAALADTCRAGGYDLTAAAGRPVTFTGVDVEESCAGEPAMAWVVTDGDVVRCAYLSVRRGSLLAPGIWPVRDPSCR